MMKKRLLIFALSFVPLLLVGQNVSVDSLLHKSDSIRLACDQLKEKDPNKLKGLEQVMVLQDSVYRIMADSARKLSSYKEDAFAYRFFTCTDVSVFKQNYREIDIRKLPGYLQKHYLAITTIRQFSQCIESMENKISKAENDEDVSEADRKQYVAIKIKSEIDKANELLDAMDEITMNSLNDEQKKYYQSLSAKLDNILTKYIF